MKGLENSKQNIFLKNLYLDIIVNLPKSRVKEKDLKGSREKRQMIFKGTMDIADFSIAKWKTQTLWNLTLNVLKKTQTLPI